MQLKLEQHIFESEFYASYYYANIIDNIVTGNPDTLGFISNFNEVYCRDNRLKPYQKFSAFHHFIAFQIEEFFREDMHKYDEEEYKIYSANGKKKLGKLYAEGPLEYCGIDFGFLDFIEKDEEITYGTIESYHQSLLENFYFNEIAIKLAEEVFYILFSNRSVLYSFNDWMAARDEPLIRASKRAYLPEWVKNAVFFREKGKCAFCFTDLTNIYSSFTDKNYDHIIPVSEGGLQDVSNLQLLCGNCNRKKGTSMERYTGKYIKWY